jgi:hypothetical protein
MNTFRLDTPLHRASLGRVLIRGHIEKEARYRSFFCETVTCEGFVDYQMSRADVEWVIQLLSEDAQKNPELKTHGKSVTDIRDRWTRVLAHSFGNEN